MSLHGIWALIAMLAILFLAGLLAFLLVARVLVQPEKRAALPGFFAVLGTIVTTVLFMPLLAGAFAALPMFLLHSPANPGALPVGAIVYAGLFLNFGIFTGLLGAALILGVRLFAGRVTPAPLLAIAVACVLFSFAAHDLFAGSSWPFAVSVVILAVCASAMTIYFLRGRIGLTSVFDGVEGAVVNANISGQEQAHD